MTANAMKADLDACLAAGMNDHITKPIERKALLQTLRRWLPARQTPVGGRSRRRLRAASGGGRRSAPRGHRRRRIARAARPRVRDVPADAGQVRGRPGRHARRAAGCRRGGRQRRGGKTRPRHRRCVRQSGRRRASRRRQGARTRRPRRQHGISVTLLAGRGSQRREWCSAPSTRCVKARAPAVDRARARASVPAGRPARPGAAAGGARRLRSLGREQRTRRARSASRMPGAVADLAQLREHVDSYEYEEARVLATRLLGQIGSEVP